MPRSSLFNLPTFWGPLALCWSTWAEWFCPFCQVDPRAPHFFQRKRTNDKAGQKYLKYITRSMYAGDTAISWCIHGYFRLSVVPSQSSDIFKQTSHSSHPLSQTWHFSQNCESQACTGWAMFGVWPHTPALPVDPIGFLGTRFWSHGHMGNSQRLVSDCPLPKFSTPNLCAPHRTTALNVNSYDRSEKPLRYDYSWDPKAAE